MFLAVTTAVLSATEVKDRLVICVPRRSAKRSVVRNLGNDGIRRSQEGNSRSASLPQLVGMRICLAGCWAELLDPDLFPALASSVDSDSCGITFLHLSFQPAKSTLRGLSSSKACGQWPTHCLGGRVADFMNTLPGPSARPWENKNDFSGVDRQRKTQLA